MHTITYVSLLTYHIITHMHHINTHINTYHINTDMSCYVVCGYGIAQCGIAAWHITRHGVAQCGIQLHAWLCGDSVAYGLVRTAMEAYVSHETARNTLWLPMVV